MDFARVLAVVIPYSHNPPPRFFSIDLIQNDSPANRMSQMCLAETRKSETLTPTFASKISETKPHTKLAHTPNSPDLGFERSAHQTRLGESGVR